MIKLTQRVASAPPPCNPLSPCSDASEGTLMVVILVTVRGFQHVLCNAREMVYIWPQRVQSRHVLRSAPKNTPS